MKFGIHSEQYANNYSKEERKKFTQVFGDLTLKFAEKMKEQVAASDPLKRHIKHLPPHTSCHLSIETPMNRWHLA
jgi:hypothetical protein